MVSTWGKGSQPHSWSETKVNSNMGASAHRQHGRSKGVRRQEVLSTGQAAAQAGNHTQRWAGTALAKLRPCRPVSPAAPARDMPGSGASHGQRQVGLLCRLRDRWRPGVTRTSLHTARTGAHVSGQSQVEGTSQCPVAAWALSGVDRGCQPRD